MRIFDPSNSSRCDFDQAQEIGGESASGFDFDRHALPKPTARALAENR